ncbi:MAG: hypothetical protein Q9171_006210 [Xanthocarpia ochracea]
MVAHSANSISIGDGTEAGEYRRPHLRARRSARFLPQHTFDPLPTPSGSVSLYDFFDGSSVYPKTATLSLTTRLATNIITSGTTESIPATTYMAANDKVHVNPADGCWDDPHCWFSKTHTASTPIPTAAPNMSEESQQLSVKDFLKYRAPYYAAGVGVAVLMMVGVWLAFHFRAKKLRKRSEEAKERQKKRMGGGRIEGSEAGSGEAPVPLQPLNREQDTERPRTERVYSEGYFGGRSEMPMSNEEYGRYGGNAWERW